MKEIEHPREKAKTSAQSILRDFVANPQIAKTLTSPEHPYSAAVLRKAREKIGPLPSHIRAQLMQELLRSQLSTHEFWTDTRKSAAATIATQINTAGFSDTAMTEIEMLQNKLKVAEERVEVSKSKDHTVDQKNASSDKEPTGEKSEVVKRKTAAKTRILQFLIEHPGNRTIQIAEHTGLNLSDIEKYLGQLRKLGLVTREKTYSRELGTSYITFAPSPITLEADMHTVVQQISMQEEENARRAAQQKETRTERPSTAARRNLVEKLSKQGYSGSRIARLLHVNTHTVKSDIDQLIRQGRVVRSLPTREESERINAEIIRRSGLGDSTKDIAEAMGISVENVVQRRVRLRKKGLLTRTSKHAVSKYLDDGHIDKERAVDAAEVDVFVRYGVVDRHTEDEVASSPPSLQRQPHTEIDE